MKICIVSLNIAPYFDKTPRAKYGGAEVQAAFLANAFTEFGQEVTLVVADHPDPVLPYAAINAYDSDRGLPGIRFFHPRVSGVLRALEEADADIYYQRNAGTITGLTALFCRRKGKTFVYGSGSDTDFSFRTVRIHGIKDRVMFHWGFNRADGVIVQNERQRQLCERAITKPIRVIPNGVLVSENTGGERNGSVVWIGGLRSIKRPDIFVQLATRMPQRDFVIVGGGTGTERSYAEDIEKQAHGVPNLTLTGWLPHHEVLEHVRGASLLVNTSTVEGFPNVYLEAWNHGVPVISFNDVDGLIETEELGAICSDIDGMETAIEALLQDNDRLGEIRSRTRRLVERRFSTDALGRQYVEFFEHLLGSPRSRGGV